MRTAQLDLLLDYEVSSTAHFLFNIEAAFHDGHQVLQERLTITPSMKVHHFCDERSGNRFFRLDAPKGLLSINYHAYVELADAPVPLHLDETPVTALPDEVLHYLLPSRYCESETLSRAAQQLFGQLPTGIGRVRAIDSWIHESVTYQPGSSGLTTTAQDASASAGTLRTWASPCAGR